MMRWNTWWPLSPDQEGTERASRLVDRAEWAETFARFPLEEVKLLLDAETEALWAEEEARRRELGFWAHDDARVRNRILRARGVDARQKEKAKQARLDGRDPKANLPKTEQAQQRANGSFTDFIFPILKRVFPNLIEAPREPYTILAVKGGVVTGMALVELPSETEPSEEPEGRNLW